MKSVCEKKERVVYLIYVPTAQGYESCRKFRVDVSLWGWFEREDYSQ